MTRHLDDHELASATAGIPLEPEQQTHLEGCISCRRSVDHFLGQINERRRLISLEAPDWDAQSHDQNCLRLQNVPFHQT